MIKKETILNLTQRLRVPSRIPHCSVEAFIQVIVQVIAALLVVLIAQAVRAQNVTRTVSHETENRAGVDQSKAVALTLQDAIRMSLENNRDIEVARLDVRLTEFDLRAARGAYDPVLNSSIYYERQTLPVASLFAGGENGRLKSSDYVAATSLAQQLPWHGGSVRLSFDNARSTSENVFNLLDPQTNAKLSLEITQPLFRGRKIDLPRRNIKVANKRLDISDSLFRQRIIQVITAVQHAYWDLVFARRDEEIKRESVRLALTQLESNQRAVEKGTVAPLDVISARVEVERRTDEAEAALETLHRAENSLKELLLEPGNSDAWNSALLPVEQLEIEGAIVMQFDEAMRLALANRSEIEQYRLRGELNEIDIEYFHDRTKPQIDLIAGYTTMGLAGKERDSVNPITSGNQLLFDRVNQLSQVAGLPPLSPLPTESVPGKFIGGYGQALSNLSGNEYRGFRFGVSISLPFGNRTAKAELGRALAEGRKIETERQQIVQAIEVEVRNALQAIETARRRVEAARNSRLDAEQQCDGEKRRFDAGLSTNFLVLDRQNALSAARGREMKAIADYKKAVVELDSALSLTLTNNNISVAALK